MLLQRRIVQVKKFNLYFLLYIYTAIFSDRKYGKKEVLSELFKCMIDNANQYEGEIKILLDKIEIKINELELEDFLGENMETMKLKVEKIIRKKQNLDKIINEFNNSNQMSNDKNNKVKLKQTLEKLLKDMEKTEIKLDKFLDHVLDQCFSEDWP